MAFENAMSSYSKSNDFCPTVYGASFSNNSSVIDKTNINFSMWQKSLKINIAPLIEGPSNEIKVDFKNSVSVYLSTTKAMILLDILKKYKEDPKKYSNYGVPAGQSLITICHPSVFNKTDCGPIINIKKINVEDGTVDSSYSYEIKSNYNAVLGFNDSTGKFNQDYDSYKYIELDYIIIQLEEYIKAMTNAEAFANLVTMYPYLDKIATKLGIDFSERRKSTYSNTSYFTNSNSSGTSTNQMRTTSLESMMQG